MARIPVRLLARRKVGGAIALLTIAPCCGLAQGVPRPPASTEAGRIEQDLRRLPEPSAPAADIVLPAPAADLAPIPNADSLRFRLARIDLTGNEQFASDELLAPHMAMVGREVSLADVYGVARQMTARYRNDGFILANVILPAQQIRDGIVRLLVVEGSLSKFIVEGGAIRQSLVDAWTRKLTATRPLRARDLERFLLLLNDLPGVVAQGVLSPSQDVPGAADLTVKTVRRRVTTEAGASYRGSELQGPGRIEASVGLNSIMGLNEGTILRYLQAPKSEELRLAQLVHSQRLTASGLDLTVSGSRSEGSPRLGEALSAFNLETETTQARMELSYPLLRGRVQNVRVRTALTYQDGKTDIIGFPLYEDRLSAVRVGATWDRADRFGGVNVIDIEYAKGIDLFSASEINSPTASRPGGDPRFNKSNFYVARLQSIARGVSVLFAVNGQVTSSNLLSPEEFAFGGEQFGRGFDPSEIVGDEGVAGKVELRYTREAASGSGFTLYAFGESARVKRRLAPEEIGEPEEDGATDIGLGMRWTLGSWLSGYIEAAEPTDQAVASTGKKETRVFGGVVLTYRF